MNISDFIVFQSSQVLQIRLGFIKKSGNRDAIERYDTHKGDIRKIRRSGPDVVGMESTSALVPSKTLSSI